jgi:APA family basic amino acid/polyamine antiporter
VRDKYACMSDSAPTPDVETRLRRTLTLPWLVFYGLGVTVGAGIFALIGEIVALAGTAAPMAFLVAGLVAGVTGYSYALLVSVYPYAGGAAIFVTRGLGSSLGALAGFGVAATGIISGATIALAFAGYASTLVGLPEWLFVTTVVTLLAGIAWWGVRESLIFAAAITILEVGTLVVIVLFGLPLFADLPPLAELAGVAGGPASLAAILPGIVIAFFAFIGFEDIVNMAEETVDASATAPAAIIWTLSVTLVIYIALALVAVTLPDREALTNSDAPMATLFTAVTCMNGQPVSAIAAIAMINGILVLIVMSARLFYGMAREGLMPAWFGAVDERRRTPARATFVAAGIILVLALSLPLVHLAEMSSLVVLSVFALVNLSLFALGGSRESAGLGGWRYWGLFGAGLCIAILIFQLLGRLGLLS